MCEVGGGVGAMNSGQKRDNKGSNFRVQEFDCCVSLPLI